MNKIPKHLQNKIEISSAIDCTILGSNPSQAHIWQVEYARIGYKRGAAAMYSLMLEELKPILKIADRALRQWKMYCEEGIQDDLENADRENIEAQELMNDLNNLAYLKSRIEGKSEQN